MLTLLEAGAVACAYNFLGISFLLELVSLSANIL